VVLPSAEPDLVLRYTGSKLEESHWVQYRLLKEKRRQEARILSVSAQPFLSVWKSLTTWSFAA